MGPVARPLRGREQPRRNQAAGTRQRHLPLTDGTDSGKDEHLVPGYGRQECVEVLTYLCEHGFDGADVA
ncbi:MAG: hypothetical protein M3021_10850 [Actinomycetota bacterium]|nr:hypothetical protein [Actinomycetota bacterium]